MKLFITGTDTSIGKTWVSAVIAAQAVEAGQSVTYYKPIQTGTPAGEPPEDPHFMETHLENKVKIHCRYCFEPPVTPSVADPTGLIDFDVIAQDVETYAAQSDLLLVEGAGGLAVPISKDLLMLDLIERLNIPVVLVNHTRLGTINHTLLSVEAMQRRGIVIYSLIINAYPADLSQADLCVQSLLPTLQQHLPPTIPVATCLISNTPDAEHLHGFSTSGPVQL